MTAEPVGSILVVEDEEITLQTCQRALHREGYAVDACSDGQSAAERLETERYDVLLSDLMLPGVNGFDLMEKAHGADPELAVIVMTAYDTVENAVRAIRRGAYDFLPKPFTLQQLRIAVHNALERRRVARENARLSYLLQVFQVSEDLVHNADDDSLLARVLDAAVRETGATRGAYFELRPERGVLQVCETYAVATEPAIQVPVAVTASVLGAALRNGGSQVYGAAQPADFTTPAEQAVVGSAKAALVVPVRVKDRVFGVLLLCRDQGDFGAADCEAVTIVANQTAGALQSISLRQTLVGQFAEAVQVLGDAVEMREQYGRGHCRRVAMYAVGIARALGLAEEVVRSIELAGYLHDLGKAAITENVFGKEGALSPGEVAIMRQHATIGHDLLTDTDLPGEVRDSVTHSHEWFSGKGYPGALRGEDVPLAARVLAVADAYEAMTTRRPYRRALAREEALHEIRRQAGEQFDPTVVAALEQALDAGFPPRRKYA